MLEDVERQGRQAHEAARRTQDAVREGEPTEVPGRLPTQIHGRSPTRARRRAEEEPEEPEEEPEHESRAKAMSDVQRMMDEIPRLREIERQREVAREVAREAARQRDSHDDADDDAATNPYDGSPARSPGHHWPGHGHEEGHGLPPKPRKVRRPHPPGSPAHQLVQLKRRIMQERGVDWIKAGKIVAAEGLWTKGGKRH